MSLRMLQPPAGPANGSIGTTPSQVWRLLGRRSSASARRINDEVSRHPINGGDPATPMRTEPRGSRTSRALRPPVGWRPSRGSDPERQGCTDREQDVVAGRAGELCSLRRRCRRPRSSGCTWPARLANVPKSRRCAPELRAQSVPAAQEQPRLRQRNIRSARVRIPKPDGRCRPNGWDRPDIAGPQEQTAGWASVLA